MTVHLPFLFPENQSPFAAYEIENAITRFKEGLDSLTNHHESGVRYYHSLNKTGELRSVFNTNVPSGPLSYNNGKLAPLYFSFTIGHNVSSKKGTIFTHANHFFHLLHCNHDPLCQPVKPTDETLTSQIDAALETIAREARRYGLLPSRPHNADHAESKRVHYPQFTTV